MSKYNHKISAALDIIKSGKIEDIRKIGDEINIFIVLEELGYDKAKIYFSNSWYSKEDSFNIVPYIISSGIHYKSALDCIELAYDVIGSQSIDLLDEEDIYHLLKYQDESLSIIKKLNSINSEVDNEEIITLACKHLYLEHFEYIVENVDLEQDVYELCLAEALCPFEFDLTKCQASHQYNIVKRLLTDFNCSVNNNECEGEYEYAYQACMCVNPDLAKEFYTDSFDSSILEDLEFWEDIIERYPNGEIKNALSELNDSKIEFNKEIIKRAINKSGVLEYKEIF